MADERDTLSGDGFGIQEVPDWLKDVPDPEPSTDQAPAEEAPSEETPEPTTEQVASEEETPEETETPEAEAEAPAEEQQEAEQQETEAEAEARKWAGRYESPEKLEAGYKELQREYTRTSQRNRETESQLQQYAEALKRVAPYLQKMQQEQMQDFPENREEIHKYVEDRLGQERATWEKEQSERVARSEVEAFKDSHPDLAEYAVDVASIVERYQDEDPDFFPITRQNLEVAYQLAQDPDLYQMVEDLTVDPTDPVLLGAAKEAVDNPALAEVLLAQPTLLERGEHGLNWARKQVGVESAAPAPAQRVVRQNPNAKKAAFVEKDSAGTPSASTEDDDAKAIGLDIYLNEKKSAFGV